ncbi:MAG: glycosyl transferase family 1, partial [Bacteroidetes Order II. Incertae sedis bacterium]|nr:glycosyl transferase family 1 [Bacteroidetes Order II. bacterium]
MGSEQKHVLIVAYYFPPMGLSGVQRIAKMAKYLPEAGYRVTVLTVEPGSYFAFDDSLLAELESVEGIHIVRTRSLD